MKIMKSRQEPRSFELHSPATAAPLHRCPVCSVMHEVPAARAQFAYGRQLACSPDCEAERRRTSRASYGLAPKRVPGNAFAEPAARRHPPGVGEAAALKLVTAGREPSPGALKTAGGDREVPDSRHQSALRLVSPVEKKAVISVTVESTDMLRVRRAIFQAGGESVGILKAAPVPHSSRVRVFIGMKLGALESIMTAIMRSVAGCEFGRVVRT